MNDTMKAIEISAFGGPEAMQCVDKPVPQPAAGQVLVELTAIGINLIDTYHRSGLYPLELPTGLGCEAAGRVVVLGDGVDTLAVGDRVAFAMAIGAYAEAIALPAASLVKVPDAVSDEQAAAVLLKGMTVDYLFNDTFPLSGGETVAFHAAAGGVGLLACQWAKHLGVTLIGTASTEDKCRLAEAHGASRCLNAKADDLADQMKAAAPDGYPVIFDSVGRDTYRLSLGLLAPRGTLVSFGNASGPIDAVVPGDLAAHGSLYFTRPTLGTYMGLPGWIQASADRVFKLVADGVLSVQINQRYPLAEAAQAHRDLEARATTGCSLLLP